MQVRSARNLAISLVLLAISVGFISGTVRVIKRSTRLIEAQEQVHRLEAEKKALQEKADYLGSSDFVEEEARNKLNMVKPGEEVYLRPKILGDDLLGAQDNASMQLESSQNFFSSFGDKINGLFDRIKQILLLFQS